MRLRPSGAEAEAVPAEHPIGEPLLRMGGPIGVRMPPAEANGMVLNALVRTAWSGAELPALHGRGPKAVGVLIGALERRGRSLRRRRDHTAAGAGPLRGRSYWPRLRQRAKRLLARWACSSTASSPAMAR